jgi:hypothetical protein
MTKTVSIYEQCLHAWGEPAQLLMVIEECNELSHAILKYLRGKGEFKDVLGEGVDVEFMLNQLKLLCEFHGLPRELWRSVFETKFQRVKTLLEKEHAAP